MAREYKSKSTREIETRAVEITILKTNIYTLHSLRSNLPTGSILRAT